MRSARRLVILVALVLPGAAVGETFAYPARGQSPEQQQRDTGECYAWATSQTGFDPMRAPTATAPPPPSQAPQGGALRGAARGAAMGAAVGAIAGDAGKGAAIGAASGGMLGGMRRADQRRQEEAAQQQYAAQQGAAQSQQRAAYDQAWKACMTGRGYTVN
jgi:hypothetical protein